MLTWQHTKSFFIRFILTMRNVNNFVIASKENIITSFILTMRNVN